MNSLLTFRPLLAAIIFMLFAATLSAQKIDDMFDDGGLSNPHGMLKVELFGLYTGDVLIGYEHFITNRISVLAAAGPRLSSWKPNLLLGLAGIDDDLEIPDAKGGFALNIEARAYYDGFTKGVYNSLGYHLQNVTRETGDAYKISIINFGIGYVLPLTSRIYADATFYAGLRSFNDTAEQGFLVNSRSESLGKIVGGYNLKAGYLF